MFILNFSTPILLMVAFILVVTNLFVPRSILTITFDPDTPMYDLINSQNPELASMKVGLGYSSICLSTSKSSFDSNPDSGSGSNKAKRDGSGTSLDSSSNSSSEVKAYLGQCYSSFNDTALANFDITLYTASSSNLSTASNYVNVPELTQKISRGYLIHMRNLGIVIAILTGVLFVLDTCNGILSKFSFFLSFFNIVFKLFKRKSSSSSDASSDSDTTIANDLSSSPSDKLQRGVRFVTKRLEMYLITSIVALDFFFAAHLSLNFATVARAVPEALVMILGAKVKKAWLAEVWSGFAVLAVVLVVKVAKLQLKKVQQKSLFKVDIIQPKV